MRSIIIASVPLSSLPRDGEVQKHDLVPHHAHFGQLNGKHVVSHTAVPVRDSLVFTFVVDDHQAT